MSIIKTLAKQIKEYKKDTILSPVFVALETVMEVLIPFLMAYLIDDGINKNDMGAIYRIGGLLVVCAIASLVLGILSGKYSARASAGFAKNLRKSMFYNVQNFSFSNIDKFSTASIITRHTTDITNVQMAFQMIIRVAFKMPLLLIFSLIMAFAVNVNLSLIFLVMVPFLAVGLYFIIKKAHPIFEYTFKVYDKLNEITQENIKGIRVVKSYVTEDKEIDKFNNVSKEIYDSFSKAEKLVALNNPLMQFSADIVIILISLIGGVFIINTSLTTGELTSLISYAMQILMSLMMISMIFVMIMISRASAERIAEILNEESNLKNKENPVMQVKDGSISFENVSFSYTNDKNKECLKEISVEIKSGETIGIIGGTGSSKTTFVQLIPRLFDVTEGTVKVGGIDVRDYDIETLRNQVAMVLQKNVLFSGTIKDNMRWGDENATDEEIIKTCKQAQADEFIRSFPDGYDTYIEEGGANVSGGQKQRLCIARALLKKPKILILDDSTSAVDTKTDSLIRKAFKEELPDITKLIIAQRISSVQDADKIIVLDNGRINGIGTHDELLANNEIYREVYTSQTKAGGEDEE